MIAAFPLVLLVLLQAVGDYMIIWYLDLSGKLRTHPTNLWSMPCLCLLFRPHAVKRTVEPACQVETKSTRKCRTNIENESPGVELLP